jgi:RecA-family ATPase
VSADDAEDFAAAAVAPSDDFFELFGPPEASEADGEPRHVDLAPESTEISESMQRKLEEEPKADTSAQCSDFVRYCMEQGHTDNEIAWLAPLFRPYSAWVGKNHARSILGDVARQVPKFRPNHTHPGRPCDEAGCPNKPDWQSGGAMSDEARERKLRSKVDDLLLMDEARQQVAALKADAQFRSPEHRPSLTQDLTAQPDSLPETIEGLHRTGANAVIAAQYKAGKTTLVVNVLKALADGEPFLGRYPVDFEGRIAFFNYELDELQMVEWLASIGIRNTDRVTTVHLRGQRLPLIAERAQRWAVEFMLENDIKAWFVDPFARAFAGCGNENDNGEVGAFLDALDLIKEQADVPDLWLTHHFGRKDHNEGQEHGRGATRLDDWPDVRWLLTRQHDQRFLKVEGRGVDEEETQLRWEPTGKLTLGVGSRKEHKRQAEQFAAEFTIRQVVEVVKAQPGINTRGIQVSMRGVSKNKIGPAIAQAIEDGKIRVELGKNKAHLHYPPDASTDQGELL